MYADPFSLGPTLTAPNGVGGKPASATASAGAAETPRTSMTTQNGSTRFLIAGFGARTWTICRQTATTHCRWLFHVRQGLKHFVQQLLISGIGFEFTAIRVDPEHFYFISAVCLCYFGSFCLKLRRSLCNRLLSATRMADSEVTRHRYPCDSVSGSASTTFGPTPLGGDSE